jgi:O-antigen/teichoic acid export membrane protein
VIVITLAATLVGWICAYPVADVVAHGRHTVRLLILVGFAFLPLSIGGTALMGMLWDGRYWRRFSAVRLLSFALVAAGFVALAVAHRFTVETAAGVTFTAGALSFGPMVPVLLRTRGWRFDRDLALSALSYGSRASLGDIANLGNLRLDQLLMAGLVPAHELGLYAVAVTAASFTAVVSQALNVLVLPLVAGGNRHSVRRITRITLLGVGLASGVLAMVAPWIIPLLFGTAFAASVPLVQVLVIGTTVLAGNGVLSSALNGDGHPGDTALAHGIGCALTIPALLIVLPRWGATGAAVVSVACYGIVFGILLLQACRRLGGRLRDYLRPTRADVSELWRYARRRIATTPGATEVASP